MGQSGACDNLWGLFRKERGSENKEARFKTTSRDLDQELDLMIGLGSDGKWSLLSDNAKEYEIKEHPFMKFIQTEDQISGTSKELVKQYLEYCLSEHLYPRFKTRENGKLLPDNTLAMRFSKMVKTLEDDIYLIEYECHTNSTSKGMVYTFEKHLEW